jgi:hypothetical protein
VRHRHNVSTNALDWLEYILTDEAVRVIGRRWAVLYSMELSAA